MTTIKWNQVRKFLEKMADDVHSFISPAAMQAEDDVVGTGESGDIVSKLDRVAEAYIKKYLIQNSPYRCAIIDEGTARLTPLHEHPQVVYVVDPIDGTRPALMKTPLYSMCAGAYAADDEPILGNVKAGIIHSMINERFSFERGHGVWRNGQPWKWSSKPAPGLADLRIHHDFAGGIGTLAMEYMAPFAPSYRKGFMVLNSCGIATVQLLTGGVDAFTQIGNRIRRTWPELDPIYQVFFGDLAGMHIWDLAATAPLLWEAGLLATRSDGTSLKQAKLNDQTRPLQGYDVVYAADVAIHNFVVGQLDRQEQRLLADRQATIDHALMVYDLAS